MRSTTVPDSPRAIAILPCTDLDSAEQWWKRLGFTCPADQAFDDYRMLADELGAELHLSSATPDWLVQGRNPFGIYVYTPQVDAMAAAMRPAIIETSKGPEHKRWACTSSP